MANKGEPIQRIEAQLETVIKLLAAPLTAGKTVTDSVRLLSELGLERKQIAAICNTSPAAVSVRMAEAKRQGKSARRGRTPGKSTKGQQP